MKEAQKANLPISLLIHAHGIDKPSQFIDAEFRDNVLSKKAKSDWGHLWEAEVLLVQQALKDPDVTHLMIVSSDSIPVKPLQFIYNDITQNPRTRMCMDNARSPPRAEAWWLMHRGDAQLFSDNIERVRKVFVPECGPPCGCADEDSWWYPLKLRMERWHMTQSDPLKLSMVLDSCPMYTNWMIGSSRCKNWVDHAAKCDCPKLFAE